MPQQFNSQRKKWYWIGGLLAALIAVRLILPQVVLWKANRVLSQLEDYRGHIDGVHLALWRGRFGLSDIELKDRANHLAITIKQFRFTMNYRQLLKRRIVADLQVVSPRLRILAAKPSKAGKELKETSKDVNRGVVQRTGMSLPDLLASIMPFHIRTFQLEDGTIRLQESGQNLDALQKKDVDTGKKKEAGAQKEQDLEARITHLEIKVENLTNVPDLAGTPYASGHISAQIMDDGKIKLDLLLNPVAEHPTFDIKIALNQLQLAELNPLFRWQWGVDVKKGVFAMYSEAEARKGGFKGYVKPFLTDLKMHDEKQDKDKKLGAKIKEAVVDVAAALFKNSETEKIATRVPFEGKFENPDIGIWEAVTTVLSNAFVKALSPRFDKSVNSKS